MRRSVLTICLTIATSSYAQSHPPITSRTTEFERLELARSETCGQDDAACLKAFSDLVSHAEQADIVIAGLPAEDPQVLIVRHWIRNEISSVKFKYQPDNKPATD